MQKQESWIIKMLCLILIMIAILPACASRIADPASTDNRETSGTENVFSVSSRDSQGRELKGYRSEKDQIWYLFVTSCQKPEDTVICYQGEVEKTSAGRMDRRNNRITGAFAQSGDAVELTLADGQVHRIVMMQSELPSVYIDLEDTSLEEIHADKDVKHRGNSIYIMDPNQTHNLTVRGSVEIKGRGNSTWQEFDKKAYQIKFDRNITVLGMGKARKWVLLANASDDSLMRNQLVYRMAQNMDMPFVTSAEYVDLWVEGEYLGTYTLGEKVELGSSRLPLLGATGALFEHDEDFYQEEDCWFHSAALNRHFVLKEIVEEEELYIQVAMQSFEDAVDSLMIWLYSTPSEQITLEQLNARIDVDSFIKYYLINEYALNRESFSTSFYWYMDGPKDVLHLGPIWDFDTCMGNDGMENTDSYGHNHIIFRYLLAIPAFQARAGELWRTYEDELKSMTADVDMIREEIVSSAEMNYRRWDVLGKPNPKGGADFQDSFDAATDALRTWLRGREKAFTVEQSKVVTSVVSDDCYELEIALHRSGNEEMVIFALWSEENDRDDIRWYTASKDAEGVWRSEVDLSNHNSAGIYHIIAYTRNQESIIARGSSYVKTAREPLYPIELALNEAGNVLSIRMTDAQKTLTSARFAIWGVITGQETTLQWLTAEKTGENVWTAQIPLCGYHLQTGETFAVHAYGEADGEDGFRNDAQIVVDTPVSHNYPVDGAICVDCGYVCP